MGHSSRSHPAGVTHGESLLPRVTLHCVSGAPVQVLKLPGFQCIALSGRRSRASRTTFPSWSLGTRVIERRGLVPRLRLSTPFALMTTLRRHRSCGCRSCRFCRLLIEGFGRRESRLLFGRLFEYLGQDVDFNSRVIRFFFFVGLVFGF